MDFDDLDFREEPVRAAGGSDPTTTTTGTTSDACTCLSNCCHTTRDCSY